MKILGVYKPMSPQPIMNQNSYLNSNLGNDFQGNLYFSLQMILSLNVCREFQEVFTIRTRCTFKLEGKHVLKINSAHETYKAEKC